MRQLQPWPQVAPSSLGQSLQGLLPRPRGLILMDEPSSDVDTAADAALHAALLSRPETLLAIAHRRVHLRLFDAVCEVVGGRCARLCTPAEYLASSKGSSAALVDSALPQ